MSVTQQENKSSFYFKLFLCALWFGFFLWHSSSFLKKQNAVWDTLATEKKQWVLQSFHLEFQKLFQAYYFYSFEENFKTGLNRLMEKKPDRFSLKIIHLNKNILFETDPIQIPLQKYLSTPLTQPIHFVSRGVMALVIPAGEYQYVYVFEESAVWWGLLGRYVAPLVFSILSLFVLIAYFTRQKSTRFEPFIGLRLRLVVLVGLMSLITSGVIFFSLSHFQKKEHLERIEKEFLVFSEFAVDRIILDFSQSFYFYFNEKFIPSVQKIISAHPSLQKFRIISASDKKVLYDSLTETATPPQGFLGMSLQQENEMILRGKSTRLISNENGVDTYEVVLPFYSERSLLKKEPLYYVEFVFSLERLHQQLNTIRDQILFDLIPSLILSLLIAFGFAHYLVRPIQKLILALEEIRKGKFDHTIQEKRTDEIGSLILAFNEMSHELKKKNELRRFISHSSYEKIMEATDDQGQLKLMSTKIKAVVLFCDLRNFVTFCDLHEAEEVTSVLNEYFSEMVKVVARSQGEVDKFIGDAFLAVFHPISQNSMADFSECIMRALFCALEMKQVLAEFNEKRVKKGKSPLENGIGVSFGELVYGPVGADDRLDFTVIGDTVNVASRVEKLSRQGRFTKVLFSQDVFQIIADLVDSEEILGTPLKGKKNDLRVFELVRIKTFENIRALFLNGTLEEKLRCMDLLGLVHTEESAAFLKNNVIQITQAHEIRSRALRSLTQITLKEDPLLTDQLLQLLAQESSSHLQSSMISCLGKVCPRPRLMELSQWLDSEDERIVANTIEVISTSPNEEVLERLFSKLESRSHRIKANAALALFRTGRIEVIYILKPMLIHSDPKMRASACFAVGELSRAEWNPMSLDSFVKKDIQELKKFFAEIQDTVPMLIALLKDKDFFVKKQALIALGKIKNKSAVLALIDELNENDEEWLKDVMTVLVELGVHPLVKQTLEKKYAVKEKA